MEEEERLRVLQEERSSLKELIGHVGWKELMTIAAEQLQLRMPGALSKTLSVDEVIGKEFEKGEIAGIELFCALPGIRIASLDEDMIKLEEELGYAEGERTIGREDRGGSGSRSSSDEGEFEPPV